MNEQDTPATEQPHQAERRVHVRVPSNQEACCHFATIDKIEGRWAKVRDLSKAGVSLVIDRGFEPGQQVVIELPSKTEPPASVSARVVRVVHEKNGAWLIGCWFGRLLSDEEFAALL